MDRSIEATHHEFNSIRTGRASPALLDRITIDYYGTPTPLKSLASIGAPEPRLLTVQPFDPGSMKSTERAIQESDLGRRHPTTEAHTPSDPDAHRGEAQDLVKVVRRVGEDGKVAIRNVRRDVDRQHLRELVTKGMSATTRSVAPSSRCRSSPDEHTKSIDDLLKVKEAEIMEVLTAAGGRSAAARSVAVIMDGTDAGRQPVAFLSRRDIAKGRRPCAGPSKPRSISASSRSSSTRSRPKTGRVRPMRSTRSSSCWPRRSSASCRISRNRASARASSAGAIASPSPCSRRCRSSRPRPPTKTD